MILFTELIFITSLAPDRTSPAGPHPQRDIVYGCAAWEKRCSEGWRAEGERKKSTTETPGAQGTQRNAKERGQEKAAGGEGGWPRAEERDAAGITPRREDIWRRLAAENRPWDKTTERWLRSKADSTSHRCTNSPGCGPRGKRRRKRGGC